MSMSKYHQYALSIFPTTSHNILTQVLASLFIQLLGFSYFKTKVIKIS